MIVVADTGPLNYLVLIEHIDILPRLFERVAIPMAVAHELSRPQCTQAVRHLIAQPPAWLTVHEVPALPSELAYLHAGEQAAIALALSLQATILLCDDRAAREAAMRLDLACVGTLGVLAGAADLRLVDFEVALERLRATNFRMTPALVRQIIEQRDKSGTQ